MMAKKVFLGMRAVMTAPSGGFSESQGSEAGYILPILHSAKNLPSGKYQYRNNSDDHWDDYLYHIDLKKRIISKQTVKDHDDAIMDGWGIDPNGDDLAMPINKPEPIPRLRHTTIGATWPYLAHVGVVYLDTKLLGAKPLYNAGGWPATGYKPGEMITISYNSPDVRYMGFRAIIKSFNGNIAALRLFNRRNRQEIDELYNVDFTKTDQCDSSSVEYILWNGQENITQVINPLSLATPVDSEGIVFLNVKHIYHLANQSDASKALLLVPKEPFWLGS